MADDSGPLARRQRAATSGVNNEIVQAKSSAPRVFHFAAAHGLRRCSVARRLRLSESVNRT